MQVPLLVISIGLAIAAGAAARIIEVRNPSELAKAIAAIKEGDVLSIHPGNYPGGNAVAGIAKLTVEAADPDKPPHFKGGRQAWHFSRCPHLKLRNLHCSGQSANGINIDDGGPHLARVPGVVLENLVISDIGPIGNFDAIKCSGLTGLTIRNCEISGWGGQAIDLVGCQRVLITACRIVGKPGFSQHTGPQFKGGCEDVTLENCDLIHAGARPIQAGGSTGPEYFRPPGARFEARRIIIRNNRITGGDCACAFTGVDGAEFSANTVTLPTRWILRILTENTREGFPPARMVTISNNTFVFRRDQIHSEINIGPNTAAHTFSFTGNHWLAQDRPEQSVPKLPVPESKASYGALP